MIMLTYLKIVTQQCPTGSWTHDSTLGSPP